VDQLRIDEIVQRIDSSFGEEPPFSARALTEDDLETLERVFGDVGYQDYLEDQANRQIIRVYLTNAAILGVLPEQRIDNYSSQVESNEGRAALSLHMLMNSVEDADRLPLEPRLEELKSARSGPGSPPNLRVVRT
jgi:hypothetical protein